MLIEFQKDYIYKMLHFDNKVMSYSRVDWIDNKKRKLLFSFDELKLFDQSIELKSKRR